MQSGVLECGALPPAALTEVFRRFGVERVDIAPGLPVPGSYWGAPEAGLIADRLYVRPDTPVHSALHELAHFVCMSRERRARLDTDAGGDPLEECAVCYLQLLLADEIAGFGCQRCLRDMDTWGYSFREGSAGAWFAGDARDACEWLLDRGLIAADGHPTWQLRI
jgi:hypothetical protein